MTEFDWQPIVGTIGPSKETSRYRLGQVVSVQADYTITVTIAGSTTQVSGVRYMANVVPIVGSPVWLTTDGKDIFASGVLANSARTVTPRAARSTDQSIPNTTDTAISFDSVNTDPLGSWDSGSPTRLTAKLTGRYIATGQVAFAGNATGFRIAFIEKNGTSTLGRSTQISVGGGNATWVNVTSMPFDMTGGTDYIRLMAWQNSGGALNANTSGTFAPSLSLIYLGP